MTAKADILARIARYKREEIHEAMIARPLNRVSEVAEDASPPRGFRNALATARTERRPGLIAEIKKASPSKGMIRADFDPPQLARSYEKGGAACLSVLTDAPSFHGAADDLETARQATSLPVLRKDFMLDPYQIVQSRALGADCVLLIMALLDDAMAEELHEAATEWEMDALVEVHNERELERALKIGADFIGINNRDLKSFRTDIETTIRLMPMVPDTCLLVAESGLSTAEDLNRLTAVGVSSFLVGESLMRADNVEAATQALLQGVRL